MTEIDYTPAPAGPLSDPAAIPASLAQPQVTTYPVMNGTTAAPVSYFGDAVAPPETAPAVSGDFTAWAEKWLSAAGPEVQRKAAEYGSGSLARKGRRYARAQQRTVNTTEALELGAAQYVLEKMDRVEDMMLREGLPSEDTWVDVANYALMVLFIRANGHWL